MRQPVVLEKVFVEKVTERTVPDVVQQARHSHQRFDVAATGNVGTDFTKAVVQAVDGSAGQVHDSHDVLEPGVLGRREDPPGGLQLMDLPHPLHPRMVDDLLLRNLPRRQPAP